MKNNGLDTLIERGFFKQCTNREALDKLMDQGPITFYAGVDPTASSLHVGHMVPFFAMHHLQQAGHNPIALVGGGTAMIGDPSGRTETRKMLSVDQISYNVSCIKKQLSSIIDFTGEDDSIGKAELVNNADWIAPLNYIEFLRDIGKHFSVNRMLSFEGYKMRMQTGLSFIEFNYQLLQSYDFLSLFRENSCQLQIGGDDQWANIISGVELIRRIEGEEVYGLTFPLVTRSDGKKMGKTEKGALYLDPNLVSPFEFFQYWRNIDDKDVGRFLKLFTFLSLEEISELEKLEGKEINKAKEVLAYEYTKVIHGQDEADKAKEAARAAFKTTGTAVDKSSLPSIEINMAELEKGIDVMDLYSRTTLCSSRSAARRLIEQGGAYANSAKITDINTIIDSSFVIDEEILLRAGKKRYFRIIINC